MKTLLILLMVSACSSIPKSNIEQRLAYGAGPLNCEADNDYFNSALCEQKKGDLKKARYFYGLALSEKKIKKITKAKIHNNLGVIYSQVQNFTLSKLNYQKAMKLAPNLEAPKYNLAQLYLEFSQTKKANVLLAGIKTK